MYVYMHVAGGGSEVAAFKTKSKFACLSRTSLTLLQNWHSKLFFADYVAIHLNLGLMYVVWSLLTAERIRLLY